MWVWCGFDVGMIRIKALWDWGEKGSMESLVGSFCRVRFKGSKVKKVKSERWKLERFMESRGLRNVEGLKVEKGKKDRTLITLIKRMVADKSVWLNHIHFNPKQSEAMPIRPLSVFFCVAKESSSFIRVIRVPIIPVLREYLNPKNL